MKETPERKQLSPSVRYLISIIKERIQSGEYVHGRWLPSERALAEEFSVCRPTIRQVIVELEKRNLIQRSARHRPVVWNQERFPLDQETHGQHGRMAGAETTLADQPAVSNPDRQRVERVAGSIGLWISGSPRDMGPVALTSGVHQGLTLQERPLRVITGCPQGNDYTEILQSEKNALVRMANDPDIAGVILWYLGGEENRPALEQLRAAGKMLVFVDREPPTGLEADFVGVHNTYAAAAAVRYLLKQGHRHIAHLTNGDRASTVLERRQGYEQALHEAGIPLRPEYILQAPFKIEREEEQHWVELTTRLRSLPEPPTAVFAINDYTAWRFIQTWRSLGGKVPKDIAVVGFDNTERWSAMEPFMTSVSQPFEQIGREAAKLLLLRCDHSVTQTYRHVLLPAELVIRGSSE